MSNSLREKGCTKGNESGPDYLGYYKHIVSDLLSQEDYFLSGIDNKASIVACSICGVAGICSHNKHTNSNGAGDSISLFSGVIGEGLSDFKKERFKAILNESVVCINQDVDEVLEHIIALFQIESDIRERELLSYCSDAGKVSSPITTNPIGYDDTDKGQAIMQVYKNIKSLQRDGEEFSEAVENYSLQLCSQLGKMEQDLEEYINSVVSKSRPMTAAEKQLLAQRIQKLPDKALGRVVELIQLRNLSARKFSDTIPVNFEEQDDITLWRLHFFVETVMQANKL